MDKKTKPGFSKGFLALGGRVLYWFTALLWWEALTQWTVFGEITVKFGYVAMFSAGYALILGGVLSLTGKKPEKWLTLLVSVVGVLLYGSQLVYNYVFGTLYSVALMEQYNERAVPGDTYQALPMRLWKDIYGLDGIFCHTGSAYGVYNCASYDPATGNGVVVLTVGASGDKDDRGIYRVCAEINEFIYGVV